MLTDSLVGYDAPVTPEFVKEVWKSIQFTMYRTTSTTELTSKQCDEVYDVLNKFLSQEFGVHLAFPSIEAQAMESLDESHA